MPEFYAKFTKKIQRTSQILSFQFVPEAPLTFIPGQFTQVIFDQENRADKDLNKYLSFSCAPGKEYFEVTKRLTGSGFSNCLDALQPGDRVLFQAPMGRCVIKPEYSKILFLAGGIGVTPVISILEHVMEKNLPNDCHLLYSNLTENDIAFKSVLDQWQAVNKRLKILYTVVSQPPVDKNIVHGMIDQQLLRSRVLDYGERTIFIFGPMSMVKAMQELCLNGGCSINKILIETFSGYL